MTDKNPHLADLRQRAEGAIRKDAARAPKDPVPLTLDAAREMLHEMAVHQVELEMQNEELRRAQVELETARTRYSDLYHLAPAGYCTVDDAGLILEANLTAATMLGVARHELVNELLDRFIVAEDRDSYYLFSRQLLNPGGPRSCEVRIAGSNGAPAWALFEAATMLDMAGARVCGVVLIDIDTRKRAEVALQELVREKEALLREVHHRVRNNLQVVTSLIRLEAGRNANVDTRSVLSGMQGRIRAMALLHDALSRSGSFSGVDLGSYLRHLAAHTYHAIVAQAGLVQLHLDVASVLVQMDQAMPCGLVVDELISNSLKHGFPDGRTGEVRVELQPVDGGPQVRLRVSDTGVGLPADFETRRRDALGLQLVSDLASQLRGTLTVGPGPTAVFTVTFTPAGPRAALTTERAIDGVAN